MTALLLESAWPLGTPYFVAGYAVIFVTYFGYLAWIHVASRRLGRRLEDLERRLRAEGAAKGRD